MSQLPNPLITSDTGRLSGTPVLAGTRVPVQTLFEYLDGGETLDTFLDHFPWVDRAHAEAIVGLNRSALLAEISRVAKAA